MINLNQAECMKVLEPYLLTIHDLLHEAFHTYQTKYPEEVKADHDNAAAATCVHRHILTNVNRQFMGVRGAKILNARGLKVLNINDRIVGRWKKLNEDGQSSSYPTKQARSYDRQLPLPHLPPAATRLTFGYEPDLAFTAIQRVVVACPHGRRPLWCSQVLVESREVAWVDITPRRIEGTEDFSRYGEEE